MTTTSTDATSDGAGTAPAGGPRAAALAEAIADKKLKAEAGGRDAAARLAGLVLIVVGVVGGFVAYTNSLGLDDGRDIASMQILAIAFVTVTVAGAGLYVAGVVAKVLRLWLLRQLVESQDRMDQLVAVLGQDRATK